MKDLKVVEEVIKQHTSHPFGRSSNNAIAKAILAALEKDGWAKFETPYDECAFCCHTNQETLEQWFVKWAEDNGYVKAEEVMLNWADKTNISLKAMFELYAQQMGWIKESALKEQGWVKQSNIDMLKEVLMDISLGKLQMPSYEAYERRTKRIAQQALEVKNES